MLALAVLGNVRRRGFDLGSASLLLIEILFVLAQGNAVRGNQIVNQLANTGDYVSWTYQTTAGGDYYTCLTLDPNGRFYGQKGIHLGATLPK